MRENITALYPDTPAFYKLILADGKYYVGSTKRLAKRLRDHRHYLETGTHHNAKLSESFTTWSDIQVEYEEYQYLELARLHEQAHIDENYNSPLICNIATGVDSFWGGVHGKPTDVIQRAADKLKGYKHTDEFKDNCRQRMLGSVMSDEQKQKISQSMKGIVFSDEHRTNLSKAGKGKNLGRKPSIATLEKMRIASTGRTMSEDAKRKIAEANFKRVVVLGVEYNSLQECATAFGVSLSTVTNRAKSDKSRWMDWKLQ